MYPCPANVYRNATCKKLLYTKDSPVDNLLLAVVALCSRWLQPRHNVQVQFLEAQIRILRERVKAERIILSPTERAELLRLGSELEHQVGELLHVVKPDTYRRWRQDQKQGKVPKGVGRPPLAKEIQDLIVRFATENAQWGYRRIVGELKKLGHEVSASAARGVLVARDLPPTPKKSGRQLPMAWTKFVRANVDSLVATDFFTQPVHTLTGTVYAYVLVFVHLGSRRVFASPATLNPDAAWMQQQARNAAAWVEDEGLEVKWLIHDRDAKFSRRFRGFWSDAGIRPLQTPRRAPRANSYCESFIGTVKRECLDYFFCLSLRQVDYILREWLEYYHAERPHQGKGNNVLTVDIKPQAVGEVRSRERLGGVVREYYREAA